MQQRFYSLIQTRNNLMNTGKYDPKHSIEELDYSNNVSKTIKIERDEYVETWHCEESDVEENDSPEAAQVVVLNVTYESNLCLDDREFFKVKLKKGKTYELELSDYNSVNRLVVIGPDNSFYARINPYLRGRTFGSVKITARDSGWFTLGFLDDTIGFVRTKADFKIQEQ